MARIAGVDLPKTKEAKSALPISMVSALLPQNIFWIRIVSTVTKK